MGRPPSVSERLRDLSRLALFRPEHQELLLRSYWGPSRGRAPPRHLSRLSPRLPVEERIEETGARRPRPGQAAAPAAGHARPYPGGARRGRSARQGGLGPPLGPAPPARRPARQAAGAPGRCPLARRRGGGGRRRPAADLAAVPETESRTPCGAGRFRRHRRLCPPLAGEPRGTARPGRGAGGAPRAARLHPWEEDHARRGGAGARAPRPRPRGELRPAAEPRAGARPGPLAPVPGGDRAPLHPLRPALPGGAGDQPQQVGDLERPRVRRAGARGRGGPPASTRASSSSAPR